jgi:hypothetical protein
MAPKRNFLLLLAICEDTGDSLKNVENAFVNGKQELTYALLIF